MPLKNDILRFVAHGRRVQKIAELHGWLPGARYTNLRDVRGINFHSKGFLDIDWKNYDFRRHLLAAQQLNPLLTVARDIFRIEETAQVLNEAEQLLHHSQYVIVVPKDPRFKGRLRQMIPGHFLLGYSVPTRYGGTPLHPGEFENPVHLLGGRPDIQRELANHLPVFSFDCNRFTLDAAYGDYFDGQRFRPHPKGGYENCLIDSIVNINKIWASASLGKCNL